jgi:hypothetical protein
VAPVQPKRELGARKAKKNQGKNLGFPWIPLAESGLFKGLRRIQIKKSRALSTRLSGCGVDEVMAARRDPPDEPGEAEGAQDPASPAEEQQEGQSEAANWMSV